MVKMASCPTKEDLIRLNYGDLPGDQLESVCDHVEICEKCQLVFGQLDEPPNNIGKQLAKITQADLENARIAIEEETLQDRATTIWGQVAPRQQKGRVLTLTVPCNLRQYEVLKLIGYGGMGEVYEGRHSNLKRPVALKVIQGIRQDDPVAYQHFLQEMETAGQLEHPNLVRAYDAWEHDGCLFLAQELLDGDSLQELASQGMIRTPEEIIDALLGTCRALEQLHAKGFVHRDVKPGNIMRQTDGTIKLIDYGLAIAAESGKSAARIGAGTVGYMSPEQAHGSGPVDYRSDIYATGRVLKYLLIKLPSDTNDPKRVSQIKILSKLANRLAEKDPQKRPKNIYSVAVKLEQLQQSVKSQKKNTGSPAPSSDTGTTRQKRRRPGTSARSKHQRVAAPEPQIEPQSQKKRVSPWLYLVALILGMGSFGAYQLIFTTDRQATILVENHQPGDVIHITSEDGKVRSVELSDQAKFGVEPGSYEITLDGPGNRQLTPGNITVKGRDQLNVRIENASQPSLQTPSVREPSDQAEKSSKDLPDEAEKSMIPKPNVQTPKSLAKMVSLSAPFSTNEINRAREVWSKQLGLPVVLEIGTSYDENSKLEFILIPPGTFQMGIPDSLSLLPGNKVEWVATSKPAHQVIITNPFYICRYEVTQKQFRDVKGGGLTPVTDDGTRDPATQIPWNACVGFCYSLTETGTNLPDGTKIRLPTEAEWEYACRAGTTTRFWLGNQIGPQQASLRNSGRRMKIEPVNKFQPNPFGLYNVHGNVSEWCSDWLSPYSYTPGVKEDPTGLTTGTRKVIRGGGYSNPPFSATSYWRMGHDPKTRSGNIGFRPVIELPQQ
jgi:formylglycine-generating enzyme required for sulfatase activity